MDRDSYINSLDRNRKLKAEEEEQGEIMEISDSVLKSEHNINSGKADENKGDGTNRAQ